MVFYFSADVIEICKENLSKAGTDGTIIGSLTPEELSSKSNCTLDFIDVPENSIIEIFVNKYELPLGCDCNLENCNYLLVKAVGEQEKFCSPSTRPVYVTVLFGGVTFEPIITNNSIALSFNLTYKGK